MKSIGRIFLTGVLTVLPVLATAYLLIWLFTTAESFLGKPLKWLIPEGYYRGGMGLLVGIVVIFVVGVLMRAYIVRRVFAFSEKILLEIPLIKTIYAALRDFFGMFAGQNEQEALQVVTVTLPGTGMRLMGFVTRDEFSDTPKGIGGEGEVTFNNLHEMELKLRYFPERYDDRNSFGNGTYKINDRPSVELGYQTDEAKAFSGWAFTKWEGDGVDGQCLKAVSV